MRHHANKMRFLAVKLSALQSELDISKQILESAGKEVDKMFQEKYFPELAAQDKKNDITDIDPNIEVDDHTNTQSQNDSESSHKDEEGNPPALEIDKVIIDPEVKKLFKKISLLIHPDKLIGMEDGYERNNKEQLYLKAIKAKDENDLVILADIAIQLGLTPPEISKEKLKMAENKINDIKKELKHIESTFVWQWFFCSDDTQKNTILEKLFEIMYDRRN